MHPRRMEGAAAAQGDGCHPWPWLGTVPPAPAAGSCRMPAPGTALSAQALLLRLQPVGQRQPHPRSPAALHRASPAPPAWAQRRALWGAAGTSLAGDGAVTECPHPSCAPRPQRGRADGGQEPGAGTAGAGIRAVKPCPSVLSSFHTGGCVGPGLGSVGSDRDSPVASPRPGLALGSPQTP